MKGIVFNIFEAYIEETYSEETFEKIEDNSNTREMGPFIAPGTYQDNILLNLVKSASEYLEISIKDTLKGFGEFMFFELIKKYPVFVKGAPHPKDFILSIDSIIHVEVKKLYDDAITPKFTYDIIDETKILMKYESSRGLCYLAEGLLEGAKKYYDNKFNYNQKKCIHLDDHICLFELNFID